MNKYIRIKQWVEDEVSEMDYPSSNMVIVDEDPEYVFTGLLFEDGAPIMKLNRNPIGFGKDEDWIN